MTYTKVISCGCEIRRANTQFDFWIDYCPLHRAAPAMYEALGQMLSVFGDNRLLDDMELQKEVLATAAKKGTEQFVQAKIRSLLAARKALAQAERK